MQHAPKLSPAERAPRIAGHRVAVVDGDPQIEEEAAHRGRVAEVETVVAAHGAPPFSAAPAIETSFRVKHSNLQHLVT